MRIALRLFLVALLLGSIGGLLYLIRLEQTLQDAGANYAQIEDGLYMGGDVAKPPSGTKAVVNLCEKEDPYSCSIHIWEPIPDGPAAPSLDWLRKIVGLIDAQRQAGLTTFVHCRNGVSRSGLVVTAYLMYKNHWPRDQALAFVREKRPEARPNSAFMALLLDWEREVTIVSAQP